MKNKKQYIAPEMKVVEVKVESGYALSQGTTTELQRSEQDGVITVTSGNRFGGFLSGNIQDWD